MPLQAVTQKWWDYNRFSQTNQRGKYIFLFELSQHYILN